MPVEITEDMVGQKLAVFCAVEVKSSSQSAARQDKRTADQRRFIAAVRDAGGVALMAWQPEQVEAALRRVSGSEDTG
jgi:Holliday junction resolvase